MSLRIAILGSGTGSNCRAILERIQDGSLGAEASLVVSDQADAGILKIASEFSVKGVFIPPDPFKTKFGDAAEVSLVKVLQNAGVELVVLAGFMRILKGAILQAFPRRILNIHPSLLPKFPGLEAWKQALAAGEEVTGCTVHYVDAGIDSGDIIAQKEVLIMPNDTPESLHQRIQIAERILYPEVLRTLCLPKR